MRLILYILLIIPLFSYTQNYSVYKVKKSGYDFGLCADSIYLYNYETYQRFRNLGTGDDTIQVYTRFEELDSIQHVPDSLTRNDSVVKFNYAVQVDDSYYSFLDSVIKKDLVDSLGVPINDIERQLMYKVANDSVSYLTYYIIYAKVFKLAQNYNTENSIRVLIEKVNIDYSKLDTLGLTIKYGCICPTNICSSFKMFRILSIMKGTHCYPIEIDGYFASYNTSVYSYIKDKWSGIEDINIERIDYEK